VAGFEAPNDSCAGAAAFKVFLNFGGPISPEREALLIELRMQFKRWQALAGPPAGLWRREGCFWCGAFSCQFYRGLLHLTINVKAILQFMPAGFARSLREGCWVESLSVEFNGSDTTTEREFLAKEGF